MGFPRQEYWSGMPFPSPGDLPDPGIEQVDSLPPVPPGKPCDLMDCSQKTVTAVHYEFFCDRCFFVPLEENPRFSLEGCSGGCHPSVRLSPHTTLPTGPQLPWSHSISFLPRFSGPPAQDTLLPGWLLPNPRHTPKGLCSFPSKQGSPFGTLYIWQFHCFAAV